MIHPSWLWWAIKRRLWWWGAVTWWTVRTLRRTKVRITLVYERDSHMFWPGMLIAADERQVWRIVRISRLGVMTCAVESP